MAFPKKYDFKTIEKNLQEYWTKESIYDFDPDSQKPVYSVDTPPPYVSSSHLHVGHAMSYSQAEFVVRYKRMRGFNVFYPMGFDDNGLPTERYVEKKHNVNKQKITRKDFIELCLKETKLGIETYKRIWQSLGISVDWSLTYSTIDERSRKTSQLSFIDLYKKGLLQLKNEPIQWCIKCQTALAQADIETEEKDTMLHDISFHSEEGDQLVISTTRPELIPACVAVYASPEDDRYKHLKGKMAKVPLFDYTVPIKFDDSVDPEFGTGLMMVCTFGDTEDVYKWKEHGLDTKLVIDDFGKLNELAGPYEGQKFKEARKNIVEDLDKAGFLLKKENLKHNVGLHERCSTPVEFHLKPQWFINVLEGKEEFLKRRDEIKWYPDFMKIRYTEWVSNLKWDWNISRQRYYGVPIPLWYCKECNEIILPDEKDLPVEPIQDKPTIDKCPKCGCGEFLPEEDVMDTWMTSSLTPLINSLWAIDGSLQDKIYPMTLRCQAFEIIRTWLFYTVVKSHYHTDSLPWEDVMISGWGLDKQGKKMSKRSGNFVDPESVMDVYSADALRYWAAGATLGHDLRYNEDDVKNGRRLLTKLWNAAKFLDNNVEDIQKLKKQKFELTTIDKWLTSNLQDVITHATKNFDKYDYSHSLMKIEKFFWHDFCDNYLEIVKDRFWKPEKYEESEVISSKVTMYNVFLTIIKLLAPFLPYITEELYMLIYKENENDKSIHISSWPEADEKAIDKNATEQGNFLITILKGIRKYKSEHNVHQNHRIEELSLQCSDDDKNKVSIIEKDLLSAARADKISFKDDCKFEIDDAEIKIDVLIQEQNKS